MAEIISLANRQEVNLLFDLQSKKPLIDSDFDALGTISTDASLSSQSSTNGYTDSEPSPRVKVIDITATECDSDTSAPLLAMVVFGHNFSIEYFVVKITIEVLAMSGHFSLDYLSHFKVERAEE
ncbi:MAG: hypothetical protein ACI9S8_001562 [Chlamydiales bacterium]|jgi:hypothetical protein